VQKRITKTIFFLAVVTINFVMLGIIYWTHRLAVHRHRTMRLYHVPTQWTTVSKVYFAMKILLMVFSALTVVSYMVTSV